MTNSHTWPSEVDPTIMAVPVSTRLRSVPSDEDGVDGTSLGRDPSSPFHQELCHEDIKRKLLLLSPSVIGDVMRPKSRSSVQAGCCSLSESLRRGVSYLYQSGEARRARCVSAGCRGDRGASRSQRCHLAVGVTSFPLK